MELMESGEKRVRVQEVKRFLYCLEKGLLQEEYTKQRHVVKSNAGDRLLDNCSDLEKLGRPKTHPGEKELEKVFR